MTTITTEGVAETHILSERCTLHVGIARKAGTPQDATANAARRLEVLAGHARALRESGDATWHEVSSVRTYLSSSGTNNDSGKDEYTANAHVLIKLQNLARVGELTIRLAEEGLGVYPQWALTDATRRRAQREMRIAAVHAARDRADDYATALSTTIAGVVSVSDVAEPAMAHFAGSARSAAVGAAPGVPVPEVSIPEQTVSARVTVLFDTH